MDEHTGTGTRGAQRAPAPARESLPARGGPASLPAAPRARPSDASPPPGQPCSVELHIEELVLHGLAAGEHYRVGDALERELTRLLTERGAPPSLAAGGEIARLDGGAIELKPDSSAEKIGAQLAQAIYGGLNR